MDQSINCDFYIGDRIRTPMKLMEYHDLKGFKKIIPFKPLFGNFYWQKGSISTAFKPYRNYLITGDPFCVSTWFILVITKLLGKKTLVWTHGWYGDETIMKKMIKKLFLGFSYKVLLYGNYARNLMIQAGFKSDKLISIYNSLDFDAQSKVRETLTATNIYKDHFQNDFPVLLYVGRIQKSKKLELLIEALKLLYIKGMYCNLIIIGNEVDETNLQKIVAYNKLNDCVWFFGATFDEPKIGELIYNADVCISPGNIGLTAIHSMIYGTPVITHNNFSEQGPEFEAIMKGETGDYFEEDSINDLCDKIISWISLPMKKRELVRQQCFSVIKERYNPYVQIEILKSLIICSN